MSPLGSEVKALQVERALALAGDFRVEGVVAGASDVARLLRPHLEARDLWRLARRTFVKEVVRWCATFATRAGIKEVRVRIEPASASAEAGAGAWVVPLGAVGTGEPCLHLRVAAAGAGGQTR